MKPIDLARKLGINRAVISQYLSGRYAPNLNRLYDIAKVLNVNETYLLGLDVEIEDVDDEIINLYRYNMKFLTSKDKSEIKSFIIEKVKNNGVYNDKKTKK